MLFHWNMLGSYGRIQYNNFNSFEGQYIYLRRPGGDRIYGVFDHQLPAALRKLPFDRHLSLQNVRKVVSEADGYQPHLIAPEQGYRRLIEGSLNYFRGPAEASVDAVSCPPSFHNIPIIT